MTMVYLEFASVFSSSLSRWEGLDGLNLQLPFGLLKNTHIKKCHYWQLRQPKLSLQGGPDNFFEQNYFLFPKNLMIYTNIGCPVQKLDLQLLTVHSASQFNFYIVGQIAKNPKNEKMAKKHEKWPQIKKISTLYFLKL